MNTRTSLTHPMLIATLTLPAGGRIGLTFCPGKCDDHAGRRHRGTLVGRAAVAIYTNNRYLTKDLDFVTSARRDALRDAGDGRHFEHEPSGWLLEFPPGPVSFGDTSLSETDIPIIDCEFGRLRVITATQSLMDRLAAYFHWNRQPELRRQVRQLIASSGCRYPLSLAAAAGAEAR